jgi:hypothetical protein
MKAPTQTQQREKIEQGNYRAVLYRIVYMGTVEGEWKGQKKSNFKIHLTWELSDEKKVFKQGEEAKPFVISNSYTFSMGDMSNLRPIVTGMVGGITEAEAANFDLDALLGKACMLQVSHGESTTGKFKYILSTSQLPKAMTIPSAYNDLVLLSYADWSDEVFNKLPSWIQDEMSKTQEYQTITGHFESALSLEEQEMIAHATKKPEIENPNSDIPF